MKKLCVILPLLILFCITFGCQQQAEKGIRMGEAIILLDSLMEIMNEGNLALAEEIMDPDCVLRYPILPEPIVGIEAFKAMVKNNAISFSEFNGEIEELIVKEDEIWCRYSMTGKNTGPLGNLPPTGKTFHITGLAVTRVANGKIVEDETFWNVLDFYQQLGFTLTPPAPPEEKQKGIEK